LQRVCHHVAGITISRIPTECLKTLILSDFVIFFVVVSWGAVEPSLNGLNGLLYQPRMQMDDDDEREAISGMLGKGNRSTRRKPA
jgi:hypothetical protein